MLYFRLFAHISEIDTNFIRSEHVLMIPGCVAQSITCVTADTCLTADPVAMSSIPARSYTFREIDHMVLARLLKECSEDFPPILTIISYKSLQTGTVPDDWKTTNVSAIFWKGQRYDPANYRPVSLTCLCCKILEHVIVSNVLKHLDWLQYTH